MEAPELRTEVTREIAEHEVFLAFNGDSDAVLFYEWWNLVGWKQFEKWASKQGV